MDPVVEEVSNLLKGDEIPVNNNTDIEHFYTGSILITGATGFVGKVLVEKLLRACQNIDYIYLLMRTKNGEDISKRIEKLLDCELFKKVFDEYPNYRNKVQGIYGDIALPNLGMSSEDENLLTQNVTVIFHSAATVRFNEKLPLAVTINVKGTHEIIKLASKCQNLKSIVHVSTAYSHCYRNDCIEEKFYDCGIGYKELIKAVDTQTDDEIDNLTRTLLKKYPNTYCLTKAVAEDLIRNEAQHLPIAIFRPAIIIPSYREPIRSWNDSTFGPAIGLFFISNGVFHIWYCKPDGKVNNVPVDYVVNAMIAIGHETYKNFQAQQNSNIQKQITIYNFTGCKNALTWNEVICLSAKYGVQYPTKILLWYQFFFITSSKLILNILTFLLHMIPAQIFDKYRQITGRPKIKNRTLTEYYNMLRKSNEVSGYFQEREWSFSDKNTESLWDKLSLDEQNLFAFDMRTLDWHRLLKTLVLGVRIYTVKDPATTLRNARKRWRRLYYLHTATKYILQLLAVWILWVVFQHLISLIFMQDFENMTKVKY